MVVQTAEEVKLMRMLRSWRSQKRQQAAKMLAQLGTESAIESLISMANGEQRRFFNRDILNDQLLAIECLGESRNPKAFDFLKWIYAPEISKGERSEWHSYSTSDMVEITESFEQYTYPNAPVHLKEALRFTFSTESDCVREFATRPHRTIRTALTKLEQALASTENKGM